MIKRGPYIYKCIFLKIKEGFPCSLADGRCSLISSSHLEEGGVRQPFVCLPGMCTTLEIIFLHENHIFKICHCLESFLSVIDDSVTSVET